MARMFEAIFNNIMESVRSRSEVGGILPGDFVKIRKNYKKTITYNFMTDETKAAFDNMVNSGLNIKAVSVGDTRSGISGTNQSILPQEVVVTIAADQGGGRYYDKFPVTLDMIDATMDPPSIPDNHRWENEGRYAGDLVPKPFKMASESTTSKSDAANLATIYEEIGK